MVFTAFASALVVPVTTIVTGWLLAALVEAVGEGFDSSAGERFLSLLVLLAGLMLLSNVLGQLLGMVAGMLSHRVDGTLRTRVMRAFMHPSRLDHLHDTDVHATLAMARDLSPRGLTPGGAARGLGPVISSRFAALLEAGVLVVLGLWWLALPLLVLRVASEVCLMRLFFENVKGVTTTGVDLRRVGYFRDLGTTAPAAKELRVFGLNRLVADRNSAAFFTIMREAWDRRTSNRGLVVATAVLAAIATLVGMGGAVWAAFAGAVDFGAFVIALRAAQGTMAMSASNNEIALAYGAASVPAVVRLEQLTAEPRFSGGGSKSADGLPTRHIHFENVSFTYPGTNHPVFEGLQLEIPAGQRLAIVGLNGAGKTTLVKLLAGLHVPDAGRIVVDDLDIAEIDPTAWRRRIGVLFQDFLHYQLSAGDNVQFGAPAIPATEEQLDALARRVGADAVIDRLPSRWNTPMSASFTGGSDVSGGEWQRIALARALFAVEAGARILILDEPTANLDARAEAEIYNRFLELTASGRDGELLTSIVISHRFSTVRRADRIVVLEDGRVKEDGTHADLVALGGRYASLFAAQAARFSDAELPEMEPVDD